MTTAATTHPVTSRLTSIDALRGLVILFMLLDHVRETFFLHRQVLDPMDVSSTEPSLFFSRTLAHLCAPVFIFLTGLSAFLYGEKANGRAAVSAFLFKRGLFLVVLEFTLVNFAWTFQVPPTVIYLQVIWAIGLSMLALSLLVWLPRGVLIVLGLVLVCGHNLLDDLHFAADSAMHVPWAILHDRGWLQVSENLRLRTSYPLLPWIGVIALGYAAGSWFGRAADAAGRQRLLLGWGLASLLVFIVVRAGNGYGEKSWIMGSNWLETLMSILNITKYPPSLAFLSLTLGLGLLLLLAFERAQGNRWLKVLTVYGGAPMFFYLLHLYVLKLLYLAAVAIWGTNQGDYFGFDSIGPVWLCSILLAVVLFPPVRWFAALKARRRDLTWLRYL
ncbi:putative membrane protein [Pseudomonas sp. BIGb0408]|uniref:Putative membrane protein n=1 Tax=Phytopseudomonas flavescens TaxID=29435 RepID=A0A7Y9XIG1_9GAMM|nr:MULTISPECIES: heparan-alpha-glucosaminide N-acetyltransferase domain-containing protein [Pseudomonas]MCW2293449.1 putative membrane protein [Pseudomonas sp. BIGb0408]NYH71980.1 putative membrane protein [Pseudomonas flavescens]